MESDEEFDFGPVEEAEEENRGRNRKKEPKTAGQGGDTSKKGGKDKIKTCSDVVKGLETKDELETANSDESGIELEEFGSIGMFDSEITNRLMAKRRKGRRKSHQQRDSKGVKKGHMSIQADRKGQGVRAKREARRGQNEDSEE